ncbi:MAG: hypothetical protein E6J64_07370 [Deltaproteobacteria bacterium]|nr:MAG: hypothetical protein E6J64_07370 [Deltaproteobacteria bacterium]
MSFRPALRELVLRAPGARGAVFCDGEGESVELVLAEPPPAGCDGLSEYDLQLTGAQVASAWLHLHVGSVERGAGRAVELQLRCDKGSLLCRVLREDYYLVLLLAPGRAPPAAAAFALREAAARVVADL